ncbi:MAG: hypothetical protein ACP5PS_08955, partial [Bacteroidales bacterium]
MKNIAALFREKAQDITSFTFKNTRLFVTGVIVCMLIGNILLFVFIFVKQKNYQQAVMIQQADAFTSHLEQEGLLFINDFNGVAYHFHDQFLPTKVSSVLSPSFLEKIKLFYAKHQPLVSNVYLIDTTLHVTNIYCDPSGTFLIDSYESRQNNALQPVEKLIVKNGEYLYTIPLFTNGRLVANLVASLNVKKYFHTRIQPIYAGKSIFQSIFMPMNTWETLPLIKVSYDEKQHHLAKRAIETNKPEVISCSLNVDGESAKYLCTLYPFKFLNIPFVYLYHFRIQYIMWQVLLHSILLIGFNLILLFIVIFYYLQMVRNKNLEEEKLRESEEAFKEIIESMPIGIILTT